MLNRATLRKNAQDAYDWLYGTDDDDEEFDDERIVPVNFPTEVLSWTTEGLKVQDGDGDDELLVILTLPSGNRVVFSDRSPIGVDLPGVGEIFTEGQIDKFKQN